MIKTWYYNFKIDSYYTINSYLNTFKNLMFVKDLVKDTIYGNKIFKIIGFMLGLLATILNIFLVKIVYFSIIYFICTKIPGNTTNHFLYIYLVLSVLGAFINNASILNISVKKYLSLIIFRMDSFNYTKYILFKNVLVSTIYNFIVFILMNNLLHLDLYMILIIILINIFLKIIGEAINLYYYDKNYIPWYADEKKYMILVGLFLLIGATSYFFNISNMFIYVFAIVTFVLFVISLTYLLSYKKYKVIYRLLNTYERIMNKDNKDNFSRYDMVKIKDNNKIIDNKKIKNKHGYDLFNTIFFLRHKDLLYRSLNIYNSVISIGFIGLFIYLFIDNTYAGTINNYLMKFIGFMPMVIFFTNRGAIMTQAMFYNSDHAMLSYNFFREKEVILGLFKRRLLSLIKANLSTGFIIGIGVVILLIMTGSSDILLISSYFVYIIFLSLFFSIHYLVLYYLFQPYNKDKKVRNFEYSLTVMLTYFIIFFISELHINPIVLSISVIVFTIIYIVVSLLLVYKLAPKTFKLKN